jgi:hypothetical protein
MQWKVEGIGLQPTRSHENNLWKPLVQQKMGIYKSSCCELHHWVSCGNVFGMSSTSKNLEKGCASISCPTPSKNIN